MHIVDILRQEHILVIQYNYLLSMASDRLRKQKEVPRKFFDDMLNFFYQFVDKQHHIREEHILFKFLFEKHAGTICRPDADINQRHRPLGTKRYDTLQAELNALEKQHQQSRDLMEKAYNLLLKEDLQNVQLPDMLDEYSEILRLHVHQENAVVFPIIEKILTEEELETISQEIIAWEMMSHCPPIEFYQKKLKQIENLL